MEDFTVIQIKAIVEEAKKAAYEAASTYYKDVLGGEDRYSCGFAWVNIYKIKGNTKLGKKMKEAGLEKDYSGAYSIWNPSGLPIQHIDTKEAGARAAADVLKKYGFEASAGSRYIPFNAAKASGRMVSG